MRTDRKIFLGMFGPITGKEARVKYPDPQFFERPAPRMTEVEMRAMLRRNIDEVSHCLDLIERSFFGPSQGRVRKAALMANINKLHDWRNSMNMHGGGLGQPFLWEQ